MLSRLVITFLPRSKRLLISRLQSPSAMILEPQKIKSAIVSTVPPSICHELMGADAMIFVFWMLSFKPTFSLSSYTFIKRLFSSSLCAICVASSAYLQEILEFTFLAKSPSVLKQVDYGPLIQKHFHMLLNMRYHGQRNLVGYSPWDHKQTQLSNWEHMPAPGDTEILKASIPH